MIKNLAPLTYNKSFWLWDTTIWVTIIFCSICETTRTGSLQSKTKKKEVNRPKQIKKSRYSTKQSLLYLLIWSPYNLQKYQNRKLFYVTISGDQNVKKHGENLGSKLTNQKMTKFVFFAGSFVFLLHCYWFV